MFPFRSLHVQANQMQFIGAYSDITCQSRTRWGVKRVDLIAERYWHQGGETPEKTSPQRDMSQHHLHHQQDTDSPLWQHL